MQPNVAAQRLRWDQHPPGLPLARQPWALVPNRFAVVNDQTPGRVGPFKFLRFPVSADTQVASATGRGRLCAVVWVISSTLGKDADPEIPIYQQAKVGYAKLGKP